VSWDLLFSDEIIVVVLEIEAGQKFGYETFSLSGWLLFGGDFGMVFH